MTYKATLTIRSCIFAMAIAVVAQSNTAVRAFYDYDGPVLIWVTIKAQRGEGLWEACRRVYQRDVFQVAGRRGGTVRCRVDHSRIYQRGEVRQNFNRN